MGVIGVSTDGSISLHFAADHPELVRRLVIHSAAHTLNDDAKRFQLEYAKLAGLGQWRAASALLVCVMVPRTGAIGRVRTPLVRAAGWLMSLNTPTDSSDLRARVDAEDKLAFRGRLHEISVPTRETATGIPNARLALYDGKGHAMLGKDFQREVLSFLSAYGIPRPNGTTPTP